LYSKLREKYSKLREKYSKLRELVPGALVPQHFPRLEY